MPNSLKFEIDFVQDVVLPACRLKYANVWGVETDVMVMDIREICAEKIRACSGRVRYRDFYDLHLIFEHFPQDFNEIIELVRRKEIRQPICKKIMIDNWHIARRDKLKEISSIYYSREVTDDLINAMIEGLDFEVIAPSS